MHGAIFDRGNDTQPETEAHLLIDLYIINVN